MDTVLFENNKIVESLCQFSFRPINDNTIFGQYWDILQKGGVYLKKENLQSVSFTVAGNDPNITPALTSAMRYSNLEGDKLIQLLSNNISIHQVKKYEKWEIFKKDIDAAIDNFNSVTSQTIVERIDLRAINVFDFPKEDFKLSDYFNVYTSLPDNLSRANSNITIEYPIGTKNNFLVLRIRTTFQENVNVVLDLSFVSLNMNVELSDNQIIDDFLNLGHSELHNLFLSVITSKTKSLIK